MKVEIRDVIRAYDFKPMVGREDCYVEGEVVERNAVETTGYNSYKIRVTKDSWAENNEKGRVGEFVYVPWLVSYNDYPGRVINLSRI